MSAGLRGSTKKVYSAAQKGYLDFCGKYDLVALPTSEKTLLLYIANLNLSSVSANSAKVYLAAVRSLHVLLGFDPPPTRTPRIKLALKAMFEEGPAPSSKAPLTFLDLQKLWPIMSLCPEYLMFSAALSLGFFGGLRGIEYTFDPDVTGSFPPEVRHLVFDDAARTFKFTILKSKTKSHGFSIIIGCSGVSICAWCSMKAYLQFRKISGTLLPRIPLFLAISGSALSKPLLNAYIKRIVGELGWDPSRYSTHSVRAGAVSSAAAAGMLDWQLKKLGNWASDTYKNYIKDSVGVTHNFAQNMVKM